MAITVGKSLVQTPARNIIEGMYVVNEKGEYEKIVSRDVFIYKGDVYDLDVEKVHNFIANGVVTHNCIYAWRGAVNAISSLPDDIFKTLYLTESFRFTQEIADKATSLLSYIGNSTRIKGRGKSKPINSKAIIVRTNSCLLNYLLEAAEEGKKVYVLADLKSLWSKLYHIQALYFNDKPKYPDAELKQYSSYKELVKAAEQLPEIDRLLRLSATLSKGAGLYKNIGRIKSIIVKKEAYSDFTIATGHKSKGLEWDEVTLAEDFLSVKEDTAKEDLIEQLKKDQTCELIYVALTRAKVKVNLPYEIEELIKEGEL